MIFSCVESFFVYTIKISDLSLPPCTYSRSPLPPGLEFICKGKLNLIFNNPQLVERVGFHQPLPTLVGLGLNLTVSQRVSATRCAPRRRPASTASSRNVGWYFRDISRAALKPPDAMPVIADTLPATTDIACAAWKSPGALFVIADSLPAYRRLNDL
jgi:hypothetical protein